MNLIIPSHFALVSKTDRLSMSDLNRIARNINLQLAHDVLPRWGRRADITAYGTLGAVPVGYSPVIILNKLSQPGALGYHTDENGQPTSYVQMQSLKQLCITCSHEVNETLMDPSGNRLIVTLVNGVTCRVLCEVCDPSEGYSYIPKDGDLPVSDFYFPEWFDQKKTPGQRYSQMDVLKNPGDLARGGYMSYMDANGKWFQKTWWSGSRPIVEGPFDWQKEHGESLREMIDRRTRERKIKSRK